MRVEPHAVDSIVHVIQRGSRGMEIVRDDSDRYDVVRALYILNDMHQDNDWRSLVSGKPLFHRPKSWPKRKPLVSVLAWTLLDNHIHLLLQERTDGGIAKFMQRFDGSMTLAFNKKYRGRGSIFQGGYRGRVVDSDAYVQYVHAYIVMKNTLDAYPGGLKKALANFEKAWDFACAYPFTSFLTAAKGAASPLLDMDAVFSLGLMRKDFRKYSRSMLAAHMQHKNQDDSLTPLLLED